MEITIISSIIFLILGFFIGKFLSDRKALEKSIHIQNLQAELDTSKSQSLSLNNELDNLKTIFHQKELMLERITIQHQQSENSFLELKSQFEKSNSEKLHIKELNRKNENELSSLSSRYEEMQNSHYEQLQSLKNNHKEQSELLNKQLNEIKNELHKEKNKFLDLLSEYTTLKTSLEEREKSFNEQKISYEQQKLDLTNQFKALANDILDAKTISLQETSKVGISAIMNPFQQALESFKKEVHEIHHRETQQQGEIRQELTQLKELNQKITQEAHDLATALRGQKKMQGNWGELILENVLERSGLQLGKDFQREVSVSNDDIKVRPDVVVYLPQNKHLIVDSKVSLNAYTNYINAENEQDRTLYLQQHIRAISERINDLSSKEYYKTKELNSPEIVFMFIPIESAFVEAFRADDKIFQKALEKNILVATPTTLLTSLNIVRQLWRFEDQNKHTALLASKANDVFQKLRVFLGSFQDIKKALDKANESYIKAEGQLVSGRGNLIKQVNEFKILAPSITNNLPLDLVEKANLEIEYLSTTDNK